MSSSGAYKDIKHVSLVLYCERNVSSPSFNKSCELNTAVDDVVSYFSILIILLNGITPKLTTLEYNGEFDAIELMIFTCTVLTPT
jgi:hypothetical protein